MGDEIELDPRDYRRRGSNQVRQREPVINWGPALQFAVMVAGVALLSIFVMRPFASVLRTIIEPPIRGLFALFGVG